MFHAIDLVVLNYNTNLLWNEWKALLQNLTKSNAILKIESSVIVNLDRFYWFVSVNLTKYKNFPYAVI